MAKKPRTRLQPGLRARAEQVLQEKNTLLQELGPEETQPLLHELRVHQIELEMQNDELRLAHAQLEASRDLYADLYDFAPIGYLSLSEAGLIREANLTLAGWLDVDRGTLLGCRFSTFVAAEDQDIAYLHYQALLVSGEPQRCEVHLVRHDGSEFYARLDSILRKDDRSQLRWVRSAISDITERKRAEEALRREQIAREVAEQTALLRTHFLAMISHELRTPLASIKGFTTSLLAEDITFDAADQHDFLEIIDEETDKLIELVEQLLNFSQLRAGALALHLAPMSLQDSLSLSMAQIQVLTAHHPFIVPPLENLPLVTADLVRIAQVITNLISNSVKHSPQNTPIKLSARPMEGFLKVSVSDEGSGIPVQDRDKVFQAFEQLETPPGRTAGVGLGLAICKALIEAHGGRIWIEDQAGPGTTVSFTLPIAASQGES